MDEMHRWVDNNLSDIFVELDARKLALEASFIQAKREGIKVLKFGEDIWGNSKYYNSDVSNIIKLFHETRDRIAPEIDLKLQIVISRHCNIDDILKWIEPFWKYKEIYSVDLYGDADSVMRAVKVLELDQVLHGISASNSKQIMKWLSDNKIQLNICPTSNLLLGRVESISKHPIRKLFDNDIKVTINSDDVLMFDSPVSEEYMNVYTLKVFDGSELDIIRVNGFR